MNGAGHLPARLLTALVVSLAVLAAVAGTALGARGAQESVLAAEVLPTLYADLGEQVLQEAPPRAGFQTIVGRVVGQREGTLAVRPVGGGAPFAVKMLPRTVIRRAGERVSLDALQRGDGVMVVG